MGFSSVGVYRGSGPVLTAKKQRKPCSASWAFVMRPHAIPGTGGGRQCGERRCVQLVWLASVSRSRSAVNIARLSFPRDYPSGTSPYASLLSAGSSAGYAPGSASASHGTGTRTPACAWTRKRAKDKEKLFSGPLKIANQSPANLPSGLRLQS